LSDAQALAWLDRLLDSDVTERQLQLHQLSSEDPVLHARLLRLLAAALALDGSQVLALPVVESLRAARESATLTFGVGQSFAGYRLLRELGRGGMAVVWLAERIDGVVKRQVALKLPLFVLTSPIEVERFAREKDVLAGLTHPHIARLYDAGVASSGQPFIVLEFVDGIPITAYCDRHRLGIHDRLALFLQVLAAVDHAHKHLVVHRDLKPSNILVDLEGQVKLLDFGIARLLTDPKTGGVVAQLTQQGSSALTPLYAAPEQVSSQPIATFTDIYVLGVVLHELLSGVLPYAGDADNPPTLAQVLDALLRGNSTRPSQARIDDDASRARDLPTAGRLRAALTGDLDTIVRKAMSHLPAQRYSSVEHFADDVRRFLGRVPIRARPASVWYSARLFLQRHRSASVAAALGVALSLMIGVFALDKYWEARVYEARGAAVRDFMFDLVNDAEPNELQPDAPITFLEMLDGAVGRARGDFGKQPQLQGELLNELGRMYWRLGNRAKSAQVLNEALNLLAPNSAPDDPALNKTRANLAAALLDENEVVRARGLATAAVDGCTRKNIDCAKARAYAFTVLSSIQQIDGQASQALVSMRAALQETTRAFGEKHPETAMAMLGLAIIARNAGHLGEAELTMARAMTIGADLTMRKADRTELSRTMAILDLDIGRYESARQRLNQLLPQTVARGERALQLRLLANVRLAQGEPATALEFSDAALALADAQQPDVEGLFARQARARALALLGNQEPALAQIDTVIDGLRVAGFAAEAPETLRARRFRAEILLRAGRAEDALQELEPLVSRLLAVADPPEIELGQALDLWGCTLRALSRSTDAVAAHDKARTHLGKQLPADHPFMARNTLYREAAAHDKEQFERDARNTTQNMTPTSIWRSLIDAELHTGACPRTGLPTCVLVL
jgi:serine/threonine protein kinase/tetratricopeptide (TPR) repeat protein